MAEKVHKNLKKGKKWQFSPKFEIYITRKWQPQKVKLNFIGIRGGNGDILGGAPKKFFLTPQFWEIWVTLIYSYLVRYVNMKIRNLTSSLTKSKIMFTDQQIQDTLLAILIYHIIIIRYIRYKIPFGQYCPLQEYQNNSNNVS